MALSGIGAHKIARILNDEKFQAQLLINSSMASITILH